MRELKCKVNTAIRVWQLLNVALFAAAVLTGCATDDQFIIKHEIIAQDDADLVDCTIDPPPDKTDYLATTPVAADATEVAKLQAALKTAEERERKLGEAWRGQTTNLITCNKRWKGSRDFKAKTTERIRALENQKGK